jgi:hypothetical protein
VVELKAFSIDWYLQKEKYLYHCTNILKMKQTIRVVLALQLSDTGQRKLDGLNLWTTVF